MKPVICIDPGHGGTSEGIVINGIVEKELTFRVARELHATLQSMDITTGLTRSDDYDVGLAQRGMHSRNIKANLVVSIHINAHKENGVHGSDMFCWPDNKVGWEVCKHISERMPRELKSGRVWEVRNEPDDDSDNWLQRPRNVLKYHEATAILVEVGYATNHQDSVYMLSQWGLSHAVCALRAGVCRFLELTT